MAFTSTSQIGADGRTTEISRSQLPLGAQVQDGGVQFRVWAPKRARVDVVLEEDGRSFPLTKDGHGYFSALVPIASAGMSYWYRVDNGRRTPTPAPAFSRPGR